MINREQYMEQIVPFIDKPFVKVITGIRRSGKSVVLRLIRDELLRRGVREERIIYLNFESFQWIDLKEAKALYAYIRGQSGVPADHVIHLRYTSEELDEDMTAKQMYRDIKGRMEGSERYYLLLDEVQEVSGWERAVNSLLEDTNADIYVTGSNSRMLSSELATYLTGRYVAFHVMTLSFREYLTFHDLQANDPTLNRKEEFQKYLRMGGFPAIHTADYGYEAIYKIVYDIYSSVILRDTVQRHNIRNVELLERVVKFVFDNIGNKLNAKNIADYFKSQQRRVDMNTIYNYRAKVKNKACVSRDDFENLVRKIH